MVGFEAFFAEHYDEVVRTLALATGDRDRAEDAAQEAFARAHRRWADVSQMERPVGWVVVVGTNQCRRWITRADKRHADWLARHGEPDAGRRTSEQLGDPADALTSGAALRQALEQLAPRQRATVVLRYLCDLSTEDVAKALGCSPGTVKSALHQALANLRVDLRDLGDTDRTGGSARAAGPRPTTSTDGRSSHGR